jgi:hypothetical protein
VEAYNCVPVEDERLKSTMLDFLRVRGVLVVVDTVVETDFDSADSTGLPDARAVD